MGVVRTCASAERLHVSPTVFQGAHSSLAQRIAWKTPAVWHERLPLLGGPTFSPMRLVFCCKGRGQIVMKIANCQEAHERCHSRALGTSVSLILSNSHQALCDRDCGCLQRHWRCVKWIYTKMYETFVQLSIYDSVTSPNVETCLFVKIFSIQQRW